MRVLHIMASGARGGGLGHLLGLLPALADRGIACRAAISGNGPGREQLGAAGVPVIDVELMGRRGDPRAVVEVERAILRSRPDLVHFHGTRAGFFGALGSLAQLPLRRRRWPAVYTVHGLSYRKELSGLGVHLYRGVEALICRRVAHVISASRPDLDDLQRRGYIAASATTWVPNAVDVARFAAGDRRAARQRLGVAPDAFVVGTVSRLVPQKAVADWLAAVAHCPAVTGVVIGEGPGADVLRTRGASLGARLRWLGARDDVAELLPGFDLFVLASRWEGESIALLEAMAAGLPCIATATPASEMLLTPEGAGEVAGVVVPIGDVTALAAAIDALAGDPDRRVALGAAARRAVAGRAYAASAGVVAGIYGALLPMS